VNKLFRSSLIASALTVTGIAATAIGALAETGTVDFSGNVGQVCSFSNSQPGTLVKDNYSPNNLYTSANGSISLNCNSGAVVSVSVPVDNGSSVALTPTYSQGYMYSQNGGYAYTDTNGASYNATYYGPFQDTYQASMYLQNSSEIPTGTYNYRVTVTATPQ
jgi:hypothetical protein